MASGMLSCLCQRVICPHGMLCFYEQGYNSLHLIVRPEVRDRMAKLVSLIPHPEAKRRKFSPNKIICLGCGVDVGNVCCVGPGNKEALCFDYKKVQLTQAEFKFAKSWFKAGGPSLFPGIETRDVNNFLPKEGKDEPEDLHEGSLPVVPLVRATDSDILASDLGSLTKTRPRKYQVELFAQAMQGNSLIFLPTGTGKTLVSVMVLKRVVELNPGKLAVFLADRVPLVQQQAEYIAREGNLRVKAVTGESSGSLNLRTAGDLRTFMASYDVLALTAQILLNILSQGFQMGWCSILVFDEAHHGVKQGSKDGFHPYSNILRDFYYPCQQDLKPILLGMTASPGSSIGALDKASSVYGQASIISVKNHRQDLTSNIWEPDTEIIEITESEDETELQNAVADYMRKVLAKLVTILPCSRWEPSAMGALAHPRDPACLGFLTHAIRESTVAGNDESKAVAQHGVELYNMSTEEVMGAPTLQKKLLAYKERLAQSDNAHGIEFARQIDEVVCLLRLNQSGPKAMQARDNKRAKSSANDEEAASKTMETCSVRVRALCDCLRAALHRDSKSRILVFVERRHTAYALASFLQGIPDLQAALHPDLIVGHGGDDGMKWEGEQQATLARFRSGAVSLMVSTSVLEEGIDVPVCNVVLRFNGPSTMTGLVQSRGRARKQGSRFILLLNSADKERWATIAGQERAMLVSLSMQQDGREGGRALSETLISQKLSTLC